MSFLQNVNVGYDHSFYDYQLNVVKYFSAQLLTANGDKLWVMHGLVNIRYLKNKILFANMLNCHL